MDQPPEAGRGSQPRWGSPTASVVRGHGESTASVALAASCFALITSHGPMGLPVNSKDEGKRASGPAENLVTAASGPSP